MRPTAVLICLALTAPVMLGQSKPERYRFGLVAQSCGKISTAELVELTTQPAGCDRATPTPRLTFVFQGSVATLPQLFEVGPNKPMRVEVWRCIKKGVNQPEEDCVHPDSGRLTLQKLDRHGAVGEYDFTFADGDHQAGRFNVKRCISLAVCE